MGKSNIEWTDDTWNPLVGCTHVSAGCDHCYAATLHNMRYIAWKRDRFPTAPAQYHLPFKRVQLMPERLEAPLHWRKPRRVFVNSMSDLFHEDVPDEYILQVFSVMAQAETHTFQVLTKRPERMRNWCLQYASGWVPKGLRPGWDGAFRMPLRNVWLGTSVEHQAAADERIPLLLQTPAAVRFLSCEPLLRPVDIKPYLHCCPSCGTPRPDRIANACGYCQAFPDARGVAWVIVGGESGAHARPMDMDWARSLRDQCVAAHVPFLFKQVGGRTPKANGRDLDGRTWDEYPDVREPRTQD